MKIREHIIQFLFAKRYHYKQTPAEWKSLVMYIVLRLDTIIGKQREKDKLAAWYFMKPLDSVT